MKIRRGLAVLLALIGLASPALCEGTFSMMGLEADGSGRDWSQNLFFVRMAERTGVSFTFRQYGEEKAYQMAKEEAFADGNLPDVLFKANLTPQEEMDYLASGQLVDLAPYLSTYAPNLSAILVARPEWARVITQPNGAITSLPIFNGADRQCCIWINAVWMDALGLAMPVTIEEYTDVLRAFRDGDPNGNGKRDEIPLSIVGSWEARFLLHAWGLTPNDYNLYVDDGGAVRFAPFDPAYRSFVEWLNMALTESLIDKDAFRQMQGGRTATLSDKEAPLAIGGMVSFAPYTLLDLAQATNYAALTPLEYNGERVYRQFLNGVGRGTFAITSACEDIPAVLTWADYLYTEEGGRLAFAGLEGEDYTISENGAWEWNGDADYGRLSEIAKNHIIAGDAQTPGLEPAAFIRNMEIEADNHVRRQTDMIRGYLVEAFPAIWPTNAAREARIAEIQGALGVCVDTAIANFAMGLVELNDENWQAFQEELLALGAEEFVLLWQEVYDER